MNSKRQYLNYISRVIKWLLTPFDAVASDLADIVMWSFSGEWNPKTRYPDGKLKKN